MLAILILGVIVYAIIACTDWGSDGCAGNCRQGRDQCDCKKQ